MAVDVSVIGWRAWYTNGRTFDSATTTWEQLPAEGVLVFTLYQRTRSRKRMMQGQTLYWKDGDIYACDMVADADIRSDLPREYVKRGKWVSDPEFHDAFSKAFATDDAPDESLRIDE